MKNLIINNYLDDVLADEFDLEMTRVLRLKGEPVAFDTFRALTALPSLDSLDQYTHLLLSGSEASAVDGCDWDEQMTALLKLFVDSDRPVLGICYGHQFIIAALVGRDHVRHRKEKIWGWHSQKLTGRGVFQGMDNTVAVLCNSDEVFDLPDEYQVTATSGHCAVLAFQHQTKPIWGVQFHPEYDRFYGDRVLKFTFDETDPDDYQYVDHQPEAEDPAAKDDIFTNFLAM